MPLTPTQRRLTLDALFQHAQQQATSGDFFGPLRAMCALLLAPDADRRTYILAAVAARRTQQQATTAAIDAQTADTKTALAAEITELSLIDANLP